MNRKTDDEIRAETLAVVPHADEDFIQHEIKIERIQEMVQRSQASGDHPTPELLRSQAEGFIELADLTDPGPLKAILLANAKEHIRQAEAKEAKAARKGKKP